MSLDVFPPTRMDEIQSTDERTTLLDKKKTRINNTNNDLAGNRDSFERRNHNTTWPIIFIILTVMLERAAYYGILSNLALFLSDDLGLSRVVTVASVFLFTGMAWLMSTIGGLVGDSYTGRFKAILGSLIIYIIGAVLLELNAYCSVNKLPMCKPVDLSGLKKGSFILCTLFIISIGEGAFKANITAFGAEQITRQDEKSYRMYFNWFYWGINIGSFTGFSVLAFVQQYYGFVKGYYPPLACLVVACILFVIPKSRYNVYPLSANVVKKVYHVIKEARLRRKADVQRVGCPGLEEVMPIRSWLDRAMMKYGGSYLDSEVEEVKTLGKIGIMFIILVPYWMIYYQMNSTFLIQGLHMKLNIHSGNVTCENKDITIIPAASLSLADVVIVLLVIPLMDKIVYPWLDRRGWGMTLSKRILVGFFLATASMVAAGVVEYFRNSVNSKKPHLTQCINHHNYTAVDMSIFYQVPQYGLIGISEVFASVGSLEFAYQEAPESMHGFVMGLFYLVQSVASLLGAALYALSTNVLPGLKSNNHPTKFSADLGNLDYYFYLLAAIMFVTWLIFIVLSVKIDFKYRSESRTIARANRTSSNRQTGSLNRRDNSYPSVIT